MNTHRIPGAILLSGALLLLGACQSGDGAAAGEPGRPMPLPGETVAVVNGVEIKDIELEALRELRRRSNQAPDDQSLIDDLISIELLRQQAVADGLHKDPQVALRINQQATGVLVSALVDRLAQSETVSDEDLRAAYEKQFGPPSEYEYHARHILSKTEEEARANIEALKKGADFAELAKAKSTGPSGPQGGDLGWADPKNYVAPFAEALMKLKPGEYTLEPVKTQFGWHVIKLEEMRPAGGQDLSRFRPQLERQIIDERIKARLDALKAAAKIEIRLPGAAAAPQAEAPADDAAGE